MKQIWQNCKETSKNFSSCRGFLNNLRTLKMTSKEYYDKHHKIENEDICYCGNKTKYHAFSYSKYCSTSCATKSDEHRKAVSNRFINNPESLVSFVQSRKGIDNNIQKRKETIRNKCLELDISERDYYSQHTKKSFLSMSPEDVRKRTLKRMETIEATGNRGGRSGYKKYQFFDDVVSLQGYEPIGLECLIQDYGLGKHDIMIGKSKVPIIEYVEDSKNKLYFPDFYLPNQNLLIEVKSQYTLEKNYDQVMLKCEASINRGYSIILLVLSIHEARNRKLEGSKKLLDWAISSQVPNPFWYGKGSTTIPTGSRIK